MREFTPNTITEFVEWLEAAPRPHTAVLRGGVFTVDGEWQTDLRRNGALLEQTWLEHGGTRLVWTRECVVAELIRRSGAYGFEWVRSATTAWRVKHNVAGPKMPGTIKAALNDVLRDKGSARFALDATRLEAVLAATTHRGQRLDMEALTATREEMAETHRQLKELMGFDPLPEQNAKQTIAWLASYGITVTGISSEAWTAREVADTPIATEVAAVYERALWLRRRYEKVRELSRRASRGYVHTKLEPFAQRSGRISSTEPALNNVAKDQRHLLMARPGHVLVTADFDGIEPRVLAGFSGDTVLAHDLAIGDPYRDAADRAGYGRSKEQRDRFKGIMLASAYGSGPEGIASRQRIMLEEAKRILAALWEPYPVANAWLKAQKNRKPLLLDSGRPMGPVDLAHKRPNLIIQSTAYDLFQAAALRVHDALPAGARIWLTIHDELVIETPTRLTDTVSEVLGTLMPAEFRGVLINAKPVVLGPHWKKV